MNSLVVCADDYALNPGVSRGIVDLAERGRISATSAMVLSPHWPEHAPWLRDLRDRISVGLHLDWTSPWAHRAGHGTSLGALMVRSLVRGVDVRDIRRCMEDQMDRFEQAWQAPPDHIDGHQHLQQFPVFRDALMEVLQARYPHARPWVRVSCPVPADRGLKPWLIGRMGAQALMHLADQAGVPHSQALVGITDFQGDAQAWLAQARTWLGWASNRSGVVMMCHPGWLQEDARDPIAAARAREQEALAGPQWPALLQQLGWELVRTPSPAGQA